MLSENSGLIWYMRSPQDWQDCGRFSAAIGTPGAGRLHKIFATICGSPSPKSVTRSRESKKPDALSSTGLFNLDPAASYSSIRRPYSTIGAGGLNGRVRDGIGCDTSAIATGNFSEQSQVPSLASPVFNPRLQTRDPRRSQTEYGHSAIVCGVALVNMVKPHDQLVPVSFNHY